MIVLLDMDGVMADFEQGFWNLWHPKYPDGPTRDSIGERTTFYIDDQLPKGWRSKGSRLVEEEGFFRSLPPIDGAIESVNLMMGLGHEVWFCTKPVRSAWCLEEKHGWIRDHFDAEMTRRMIIIRDKTLVRGDILVDDSPTPTKHGLMVPVWDHVIYDAPYNRGHPGRRITWEQFLAEPSLLLDINGRIQI